MRAPKARAHAERWIGSLRRECLDRLLILGRCHLERVVAVYTRHYNEHPTHRELDQRPPLAQPPPQHTAATEADVISRNHLRRRDLFGGLIHECQLAASVRPRVLRRFLACKDLQERLDDVGVELIARAALDLVERFADWDGFAVGAAFVTASKASTTAKIRAASGTSSPPRPQG